MPEDERATITMLARQITEYLNAHPKAADTIDGVASWWLPQQAASTELVQQALDLLVAERSLVCRHAVDGQALYARNKDDSPRPITNENPVHPTK